MTSRPPPQCLTCEHWVSPLERSDTLTDEPTQICSAFPEAIPDEIWSNFADHRDPFKGDHGIRWDAVLGASFPDWALKTSELTVAASLRLAESSLWVFEAPGQPRDSKGRWAGHGGSPAALHDEATIRSTFEFTDSKTGLSTEVTAIRSTGPHSSTYIDIAIKDRDGQVVGEAVRTIRPPDQRTVQHDGMFLQEGMRGQGFATRFNAHAEESYRAHGIERITTNANIDVGGYSHARAGYDFANDSSRHEVGTRALEARASGRYPESVRAEIRRVVDNPRASPVDFAMIGHTPGAKTWAGKEIMLGSSWEGVKLLGPSGGYSQPELS